MDPSKLQFKHNITKRAFEEVLLNTFKLEDLSRRPFKEEALNSDPDFPTYNYMTLYYVKGEHAGTWMKGEGWAFKSAYENYS